MPRPERSTKDKWLDQFADWPYDVQESLIDTLSLLHRQTKRQESRKAEKKDAAAQPAAQTNGQPSLTGLPDEDQK